MNRINVDFKWKLFNIKFNESKQYLYMYGNALIGSGKINAFPYIYKFNVSSSGNIVVWHIERSIQGYI